MAAKPIRIETYLNTTVVDVLTHMDDSDRRHDREQSAGEAETCALCGRALAGLENTFDIACCGGWMVWLAPHAEADRLSKEDGGWMGGWRVGPECGKRLRKAIQDAGLDPDHYVSRSLKPSDVKFTADDLG